MGNFSTAINFCESEILCWLSKAYDFLLNFNTEIKGKNTKHDPMQHNDINIVITKFRSGRLHIATAIQDYSLPAVMLWSYLTRGNSSETHGSAA